MKVRDKVIMVTGGGSGIGRARTLELLKRGARVAAVDLHEDTLKETQELAGKNADKVSMHTLNITDREAVEKLPSEVLDKQGAIDGIINCAGIIQPFVKINALDYEHIERVMNVNFYGTLYIVKAFLPHLLKRPEGHIVNISSMGGFLPVPGQSIYGASKAAVKLMSEALSSELANTKVNVTVVFPGATNTNIGKNSGIDQKGMPSAEESKIKSLDPAIAANIILDGVEKNKVRIYTGKDSKAMNRLYRLSPSFATKLIVKQMGSLLKD